MNGPGNGSTRTGRRVTVTGGAGFIGANVCRHLLDSGTAGTVTVLDDLSTGCEANLAGLDVEVIIGDLLDPEAVGRAVAGADAVIHLGARPSVPRSLVDPMASHLVNATGTMNVLEAARAAGGPLVIVASSSSVYGANPTLPKHEGLLTQPVSPYAASKLASESYALAYQRSFALPTLAFRFFNVFGPLQAPGQAYAAVIPAFVAAALAGEPLPVHGDGTQSRDFTYVDSVAEILALAVAGSVSHPTPVNLAFGTRTDLLGVAALLEDVVGHPLELDHQDPRPGDVAHSQADTTVLRQLFPDVVAPDLRSGLAATVEWMASTLG